MSVVKDGQIRQLPRRKPVPRGWGVRFDDFDLQPLNPLSPERREIHPAASVSTQEPSLKASSRPVDVRSNHAATTQYWTPFVLRRVILGEFVALFIGLMVILAALYGYSQTHQGLSSARQNDYYLWTYGPTAVFTIIAAFWGQVVYRTQQLAPWEAMATKPQPAATSVSLDYISPMGLVALYKAAKNSHYPVCLALISSFVLMGATVFSTGLFTSQYADIVTHDVTLSTTNKFDMSKFVWSEIDTRPAAIVYAALDLGLDYSAGTTERYAVQDIYKAGSENITIEATVDAFWGYLDCEPAGLVDVNVSEDAPYGHLFHSSAFFTFNLSNPSCTAKNVDLALPVSFDINLPYNLTGNFTWGFGRLIDCIQEGRSQVLVSVGTYRANVIWNTTEGQSSLLLPWNQMFEVINSTNIFCTPKYEIQPSRLTKISNSTSSDILGSITPLGQGTSIPGRGMDIARAVFQSIDEGSSLIHEKSSSLGSADTFFAILDRKHLFSADANAAFEFWLQPDNLIRETNIVYGSVAAQVAAQKLLVASSGNVVGKVIMNEPRLFMRTLSFALIEASLALSALLATYLMLMGRRSILRHDPGSLSGMAAILSKSPDLLELLSNVATRPMSVTTARLLGHTYYTDTRHGLPGIRVSGVQGASEKPMVRETSVVWWQPFILRIWSRSLVIGIPLIYIAILESLLKFSQSNDGLLGIDNNSWVHYCWTYIPALMMTCVQILYASTSFSIRLLSPYFTLHRGSVPALVSVMDHAISRTAIHELFTSSRRGQKAVSVITVATLLTPLLTIAVSGLYTAETHVQHAGVNVLTGWIFDYMHLYPDQTLVQDVFNHMNESNPTNQTLGNLATNLIVEANLSSPKWSYEELALPVIELTSMGHDNQIVSSPGASFKVSLPATRGALNCTVIPRQNVQLEYAVWNSSFTTCTYNSSSNIETCSAAYNSTYAAGKAGNRACLNLSAEYVPASEIVGTDGCRVAVFSTNSTREFGGCSFPPQVIFLPNETITAQGFGYFSPLYSQQYYAGHTYCPLYGGMVGSTTSTQVEDYTWFVCATSVQRVTAHTTFTMPDYAIAQAYADESTVSLVTGKAQREISNGSVLNARIASIVTVRFDGPNAALLSGAGSGVTDGNSILTFYNVSEGQNFDNFFSGLVYGRDGVSLDKLLGEANVRYLISAVEHLWRIIYAQTFRTSQTYLSADPRDIQAWTPQQPLNATFVDSNDLRLKQSAVATRILQGLLATLSLCSIIAFWLIGTRRVLPNNPSSIAVVAGLLTGSEMLYIAGAHAEKGGSAKARSYWNGYLFSLGWWEQPSETRRFGIDVGKAEKAI